MTERTTYRSVKEEILRRIRDRVFQPGEVIPPETALAEEFGCARATVNRALRELSDEGLVERKRRAGTRVTEAPVRHARLAIPVIRNEIEATGAQYRYLLIHREIVAAPQWLRDTLEIALNAAVLHLQCLHFADDRPFEFEDRWINIAVAPAVAEIDFRESGPNEWLVREVPFSRAEFGFAAAAADPAAAGHLGVRPGDPVFVAERTTWLGDRAITFARMTFHAGYRMTTRI